MDRGEVKEAGPMDVPIRYTLAAICFGVAVLGYMLLPVG
jgi:hypothetical protein